MRLRRRRRPSGQTGAHPDLQPNRPLSLPSIIKDSLKIHGKTGVWGNYSPSELAGGCGCSEGCRCMLRKGEANDKEGAGDSDAACDGDSELESDEGCAGGGAAAKAEGSASPSAPAVAVAAATAPSSITDAREPWRREAPPSVDGAPPLGEGGTAKAAPVLLRLRSKLSRLSMLFFRLTLPSMLATNLPALLPAGVKELPPRPATGEARPPLGTPKKEPELAAGPRGTAGICSRRSTSSTAVGRCAGSGLRQLSISGASSAGISSGTLHVMGCG